MDFVALMHAVLGTALAAAGAAALNQWWEHKFDAIMVRTQTRPIPAGRMFPREGLIVGAHLSVGGRDLPGARRQFHQRHSWPRDDRHLPICLHTAEANQHRKHAGRRDPGRVAAVDRMGGGTQTISPCRAWSLFAILFFWQMPHFFALGWVYREDYARAGFVMMSGT